MITDMANALRRMPPVTSAVFATRRMRAHAIDRYLRIRTAPASVPFEALRPAFNDGVAYDVMDYPLIRRFLDRLDLSPDDVVFDLGCGMGRLICAAARRNVNRCVGVELSPALAAIALSNAANLRSRKAPIDIRIADAANADYSQGNVFCLFNPFGSETLVAVISRIHQSLMDHPRRIRIGYNHPAHEHVLQNTSWLRCFARDQSMFYQHGSSFWCNQTV